MGRLRYSVAGLMVLVLAVSVGMFTLRSPSEPIAGLILLLTLVAFALALLAVVYRRGERRAFWLGFALLGWGYMALTPGSWWANGSVRPTLITSFILEQVSPYLRTGGNPTAESSLLARLLGRDDKTKALLAKLEEPVAMSFNEETPLEDVLKYVKQATTTATYQGIQIYVDPIGLNEADKTMTSTVRNMDLDGVPLKTTLRLLLRQLGLTYSVRDDGLLTITSETVADPFSRIGHCYWALLLACFGGFAGRSLHNTNTRDTNPT
jgi:hypothetical protein